MKKILFTLLVVMGLLSGSAFAQTTLNTTTLAAAITTPQPPSTQPPSNQVTVGSIGSGSTAIVAGNGLYVDGEYMLVRTVPTTGTTLTVLRGRGPTRAQEHANGAIVFYGPPQAFVTTTAGLQAFQGACVKGTDNQYSPIVDIVNGQIGDCQDSLWRWFKLNTFISETHIRHPVVNAAYTALITDEIIGYTSLSATRIVTLPPTSGLQGKIYIIKDESGSANASTVAITVTGATIDGTANPTVVNSAYGVKRIYSDGLNWFSF